MTPLTTPLQSLSKKIYSNCSIIHDSDELFDVLGVPAEARAMFCDNRFALKVPYAFVQKIKRDDLSVLLSDPILRQILPTHDEHKQVAGYSADPLCEATFNTKKSLLHKYQSRVLVTLTGACLVHCRYCFRQHFDYQSNLPDAAAGAELIDYIHKNKQIDEVILSGGDPLSLSNRRLSAWLYEFANTPIATIRLHTRVPIVMPARVDDDLLQTISSISQKKQVVIVVHTNHANEIGDDTKQALLAIRQAGATLLNQAVLLKGVNDDVDALSQLSYALFGAGVLPYYLHKLDKVQGAAHFEVADEVANALYWQLLERLPGYLVPKFVQELANQPHKTPVDIYK